MIHDDLPVPCLTPASAGVGFRRCHEPAFVDGAPRVGWLEVHSENYFDRQDSRPGMALRNLMEIRNRYPVSIHGVGLSLGSADPLDLEHLEALSRLVRRIEPVFVSEHLSWGAVGGKHLNDLLPIPYTMQSLENFACKLEQAMDQLQRQLLIENISSYVDFRASELSEAEFLAELTARTGCQLLLDINNVYVNCVNRGLDPWPHIDAIPARHVAEIHLAGHSRSMFRGEEIVVDTHSDLVCGDVWHLYARWIAKYGPRPTLIEWDTDIPALDVLLAEAAAAQQIMDSCHERAA